MCVCIPDAFFGKSTDSGVISRNVRMGTENWVFWGERKECRGFMGVCVCVCLVRSGVEVFMRSGESNLNCGLD